MTMHARRAFFAVLRGLWVLLGSVALVIAILYVLLTTPSGMRWLANTICRELASTLGWRLEIGSLDSDLNSYLLIRHARLSFPETATSVSVDRLHVRMSAWKLLRGELHAVRSVSVDDLEVTLSPKRDTTEAEEAAAWSIAPVLAYVPDYVDVRGVRVRIPGTADTMAFSLATVSLRSSVAEEDSSLLVALALSGAVKPGALGVIPFSGTGHLLFQGPSVRMGGLVVEGPGIVARGSASAADLVNGPYFSEGSLQVELDELPRRVSGIDLRGTIAVNGSVGWDQRPIAEVTLVAPFVSTPWASVSDARFYLATRDGTVGLRGSCSIAEGILGLSARAPVPPQTGEIALDVALVGVDLDSVAHLPVVADALAGTELAGKADIRVQGVVLPDTRTQPPIRLISSTVELAAESLSVAGVPVGTLAASWSQERTKTIGSVRALGVDIAVDGTARSAEDVDLTATLSAPRLATPLRALGVTGIDADLTARATIRGSLVAPSIALQADARAIRVPQIPLADLTLSARMPSPDTLMASLTSADSRLTADIVLTDRLAVLRRLSASLGPWPIASLSKETAAQYNLAGDISVFVVGTGPVGAPRLRASVSTTPITWEGQDVGAVQGDVLWSDGRLSFEASSTGEALRAQGTIVSDSGAASNVSVTWEQLDLGSILAALTKQDIGQVSGISDGTIKFQWDTSVPGTFSVQARVERVEMRFGNVTYQIINPPARFSLERGVLALPPVLLRGDNQRLFLEGSITRAGDLDFTVAVDSVDLQKLVSFLTASGVNVQGMLQARMHLGGTLGNPVADGHVMARRVRWRSLAIDSLGAAVSLRDDTARISDLIASFPFGAARGSFAATTAALGLPQSSSAAEPMFSADLDLHRAGAIIQNWEGLRAGTVSLSGALRLTGRTIDDTKSFAGTLRVDSVLVTAPFNRSVSLVRPATIRIGDPTRPLADSIGFQIGYRGSNAGQIVLSHSPDTSEQGLFLEVSRLSLEDVRHLANPLLGALGVTGVPSDLAGVLSASAWWNMDLDSPEADIGLYTSDLIVAGVSGDSLLLGASLRDGVLSVEYGQIYSGGDTLSVAGRLDAKTEEVQAQVYSQRIELVALLEDLLPPLRRYQPPPPWPTSMPMPGHGRHIYHLPPDTRGERVNAPLTLFDRLVKERRSPIRHPYAATLPLEVDIGITGPLSDPSVNGTARLLGGYLELESVVEPLWLPDTVVIRFAGKGLAIPPTRVLVGTEATTSPTERRIDIETATFSFADFGFHLGARVNRATFNVVSTEPVDVPPRLRLFSFVLQPLLTSYYTDPVGTFTVEARVDWRGTLEKSLVSGDIQLFGSTFRYPIAEPTELLTPPAPTSYGTMLDNAELLLNVSTEDSLVITNNLSEHASVWAQMIVSGHLNNPLLQGRVEISPGSSFRYFGRDFVVERATVDFPDPTRFEPVVDIRARATLAPPSQGSSSGSSDGGQRAWYEVTFSASGVYPNLVRTEMTAVKQPDGEIYVNQFQIMQILIYGEIPESYLAFDYQSRLNSYLKNRGYATVSAALGTVLPIERVTVQEQTASGATGGSGTEGDVEVEVAQSFRFLGQNVTVTAAAPVRQLSSISTYQRIEMRWLILDRPRLWPAMESLSLTVGESKGRERATTGSFELQDERTADIQLRFRF